MTEELYRITSNSVNIKYFYFKEGDNNKPIASFIVQKTGTKI